MFESTTTLTVHAGRLDECITVLRETVIPVLLAQPGLLSLAIIPQPEYSRLSLLSIWQTLAHSRAAEANPHYRQAVQKLDPLISEAEGDAATGRWQSHITELTSSFN